MGLASIDDGQAAEIVGTIRRLWPTDCGHRAAKAIEDLVRERQLDRILIREMQRALSFTTPVTVLDDAEVTARARHHLRIERLQTQFQTAAIKAELFRRKIITNLGSYAEPGAKDEDRLSPHWTDYDAATADKRDAELLLVMALCNIEAESRR